MALSVRNPNAPAKLNKRKAPSAATGPAENKLRKPTAPAQTAKGGAAKKAAAKSAMVTLRKATHSREEFAFVGYLLHALVNAPVSAEAILKAVREGHRRGLVDVAIPLDDGQVVLADWDGSLWHNEERLEGDVLKTQRMLEEDGAIVVRVRVGQAVDFPAMEGSIVVRSARGNPAKAVQSLLEPLEARMSPTTVQGLRQRARGTCVPSVDEAINAAWGTLDDTYARTLKELEAFVGSVDLAKRLLETHGVASRPEAVCVVARRLFNAGMDKEDVVRMDAGFWALCDDPEVPMAIVDQLRAKKLSMHRLAAMGNSFWSAAIKHPAELATSLTLLDKMKVADDALVKFQDAFWSRLQFHDEVLTLLTRDYGMHASDLHKLRSFWQTLNSQADVNALRAELATLHTRGDVTRCLRLKNNDRAIGDGARCCTHARPKVTASSATTPKATTQTSIANFFKP